ncbi:hypothetical protein ASD38_16775 [Caulobacter sp. Root487D2Y]|uniref:hypothetical protein n=1 Tax=Caulobacter sp. Root487D2Y TaxID=1736547 RepID=UPI0006F9449A|nr:hypothetical protein [Caulobacter sp. Root487D2Y]KQY27563.1 hypothetical protein ASD38_16775 [Caulobacter sp. Root487D2Y]
MVSATSAAVGEKAAATVPPISIVEAHFDPVTHEIGVSGHLWVLLLVLGALLLLFLARRYLTDFRGPSWEIDQAEVGAGAGKITLKPNMVDRQVAYAIWVELSTRKIGLPIDLDHDVIAEVYESWFQFFTITRDLLKTIPVGKVQDASTQQIIKLSINVLNEGLRPHLTTWQARFRRWYENEISQKAKLADAPQIVQLGFPKYAELTTDLLAVNQRLIKYRAAMRNIIYKD